MISLKYQEMLLKCGDAVSKEALKHEVEWLGVYDKLVNRVK